MADPFIGEIRIFAGSFAPRDWAFCDGQEIPIAQNPALFSLVGAIYGGDGRNDFGVPNLVGRTPMHAGIGPGLTQRSLGQTGGSATVALDASHLPEHSHGLRGVGSTGNSSSPAGNALAQSRSGRGGFGLYDNDDNTSNMASQILSTAGGGTAHNNLQPLQVVNFIISLSGVFPTQS